MPPDNDFNGTADNDFNGTAVPAKYQRPEKLALLDKLVVAVEKGDVAAVRDLLRRGAAIAETDRRIGEGYTALGHAASRGWTELVQVLLEAGAEIDGKDKWGNTPLMRAIWGAKPKTVQMLIDKGASPEERNAAGKTVRGLAIDVYMEGALRYAIENRQRAVRDAETARINAGHALALSRQKILYARRPRLTIK